MIYQKRKRFLMIQAIVFIIGLFLLYTSNIGEQYELILLYSIFNVLSYSWLFIQEMRHAPDFHPFQVLLIVCVQFIGLNGISLYSEIASGERIYFGSADITDSLYLGILFLSLQHLLLFSVFYFLEKKHASEHTISFADKIKNSNISYASWARNSYIFVWLFRGFSFVFSLGSISSLLVNFANFGHLLTLYLLVFAMIQNPARKLYKNLHWVIVCVEIVLVLNHGMKEDIIRTLVPYCMYLLILYKGGYQSINGKMIANIAIIGLFVVGFVFPYVSITRSLSKQTGLLWRDIPVSKVFDEYKMYIYKEGSYAYDEEKRGASYLMSRAGSIGCNAWSIDHARNEGLEPQYLAYCASAMIPRIIWRNKPHIVTGSLAYAMVNGDSNWINDGIEEEQSTSISLGFIGSCYLCLGLAGSLAYIIFISWFIWIVWNYCREKMIYNIIMIWAFIAFITVLLKDFEGFHDCGINFLFFNSIYLIISQYFIKMEKSRIMANAL